MKKAVPLGQVVGGVLLAALTAAATGGIIFSFLSGRDFLSGLTAIPFVLTYALALGFPVALVVGFALGLPAYLLLAQRRRLHWWMAMAAGAVVGAIPGILLLCFGRGSAEEAVGIAQFMAACGAVGGIVFRVALRPASEGT